MPNRIGKRLRKRSSRPTRKFPLNKRTNGKTIFNLSNNGGDGAFLGQRQSESVGGSLWLLYTTTWASEPSQIANNINAGGFTGRVYEYAGTDGVDRYRFVPETPEYDATADAFYSTWNGVDTLSGLIATRA